MVLLDDAVRTLYYGVLYFQNVMRLQGTRVNDISLTPVTKVRPYLRRF